MSAEREELLEARQKAFLSLVNNAIDEVVDTIMEGVDFDAGEVEEEDEDDLDAEPTGEVTLDVETYRERVRETAEATAAGILSVLDGDGQTSGYRVVARDDELMVDLSGSLAKLFDEINS